MYIKIKYTTFERSRSQPIFSHVTLNAFISHEIQKKNVDLYNYSK